MWKRPTAKAVEHGARFVVNRLAAHPRAHRFFDVAERLHYPFVGGDLRLARLAAYNEGPAEIAPVSAIDDANIPNGRLPLRDLWNPWDAATGPPPEVCAQLR